MFTVADVIDSFATDTYNVVRQPTRPIVDGVVQDLATVTVPNVVAVVTPISADEQFEPKGDYSWEGRCIHTRLELTVNTEAREGDAIEIGGVLYFVLKSRDFSAQGFYEALAYALRVAA